ncbi:MAG: adenylyltransferase [Thermoprotei archaeon]|nr:MAG: adenylyltransferase [Thermoprotei archaeon]
MSGKTLCSKEIERYDRQIRVFGVEGQIKLKKAKVTVIGVGGLGSISSLYLTAMGIGKLVIVDHGRLELSNLNRQILYRTKDIGELKAKLAAQRLKELNPNVDIEYFTEEITSENIYDFIKEANVVIDGLDNWKARFIVNKACVELNKPFIHAGVHGAHGQVLVVMPGRGPCLRCIMPQTPSQREKIPILPTTPAILASLQVTEAVKIITSYGKPAIGKLILYDGYSMSFHEIPVSRRENCPVCGVI